VYDLVLGSDHYAQLYAAVDEVYQYPGSSGGVSPSRIVSIVLVVFFFFLLYWLILRRRQPKRKLREMQPKSEQPGSDPQDKTAPTGKPAPKPGSSEIA
jgi:hypothetical protein